MPTATYASGEVARRGDEIYEREIRACVEGDNVGRYLVVDVESGDYEIDDHHIAASRRIRARHPEGVFYAIHIGFPAYSKIGGGWGDIRP